jgi:hypothetical protein
MKLIDEWKKALRGEASAVTLVPISERELAVEKRLKDKGYEFAFGSGFASREQFIDSLPDLSEE